jgi:hypothetical protein
MPGLKGNRHFHMFTAIFAAMRPNRHLGECPYRFILVLAQIPARAARSAAKNFRPISPKIAQGNGP